MQIPYQYWLWSIQMGKNNYLQWVIFKHEKYKSNTHLSRHIWSLKTRNIPYELSWNLVTQTSSYHPARKKCNLCLFEKLSILTTEDENLLNTRNELMNRCKHRDKHLLSSIWVFYAERSSWFFLKIEFRRKPKIYEY